MNNKIGYISLFAFVLPLSACISATIEDPTEEASDGEFTTIEDPTEEASDGEVTEESASIQGVGWWECEIGYTSFSRGGGWNAGFFREDGDSDWNYEKFQGESDRWSTEYTTEGVSGKLRHINAILIEGDGGEKGLRTLHLRCGNGVTGGPSTYLRITWESIFKAWDLLGRPCGEGYLPILWKWDNEYNEIVFGDRGLRGIWIGRDIFMCETSDTDCHARHIGLYIESCSN